MTILEKILKKKKFSKQDIIYLLSLFRKDEQDILLSYSRSIKESTVGKKVYFRGLIEYSNICVKNCYYCGIRLGNKLQERYTMPDEEVLECAKFAYEQNYGSIVIQSGERSNIRFVKKIEHLLKEMKKLSDNKLGITLSLGEQSAETYRRWFEAGAHRYLLRIETSGRELYSKYHPSNELHSYDNRVEALALIKSIGYQLGTGVMIGLPGQSIENLSNDLLFIKQLDADMVGMGPYIENEHTPMYKDKGILISKKERFDLSLRMIAVLRLMMPDINIAAATAMQTLDPVGREKAINAGANIIMPNLTPVKYRESYQLYDGKPCMDEDASKCTGCLIGRIKSTGSDIGLGEWGDSKHFIKRLKTGK
ncbi:MAG: [FeFe] hydrogenase H-cluster radical SAM maturase HydE [Candidatus Delongbacteria bacterium]|nr:[FeFe] hydrogenase H-cluster radical SAM maturase HydE [Candidatus Delongbacteria bacterium]MCG2761400.1 [FeFe] hydrogenase H-cluster radical SAM maturase HydE [Candidatus Delongbacteria bacterium]